MEYADSLWAHLGGDADVDVTTEAEVNTWLEKILDEAEEDNLEVNGVDGEPLSETTWNSQARRIIRTQAIMARTASGEPEWVEAARRIVATKTFETIDGTTLDLFSASGVLALWEGLDDENKARYATLSLPGAVDVAFKVIKRASRRQGRRRHAAMDPDDTWVYVDADGSEHGYFSGADKAEMDSVRTPGADYSWRKLSPEEVASFSSWVGDLAYQQASVTPMSRKQAAGQFYVAVDRLEDGSRTYKGPYTDTAAAQREADAWNSAQSSIEGRSWISIVVSGPEAEADFKAWQKATRKGQPWEDQKRYFPNTSRRRTAGPMVNDADLAPLEAEFQAAFAALRAAGLEADADDPIAARYRAASDAVNHANRSRDWAIATGRPTAMRKGASEVPKDYPVKVLKPGTEAYRNAKELATCGTCGRSWDDAVVTGMTPAPSARCPFEYFHDYDDDEDDDDGYDPDYDSPDAWRSQSGQVGFSVFAARTAGDVAPDAPAVEGDSGDEDDWYGDWVHRHFGEPINSPYWNRDDPQPHSGAADDELIDWEKRKENEEEGLVDWGDKKPQTYQRELKTRSAKGTYDEWMAKVDDAVQAKAGLSVHDLADFPSMDWYEDGVSPSSAAGRAIRNDREGVRRTAGAAYDAGKRDGKTGDGIQYNPYPQFSSDADDWVRGYREAQGLTPGEKASRRQGAADESYPHVILEVMNKDRSLEEVEAYLYRGWKAQQIEDGTIFISGHDIPGFGMVPLRDRLMSGLIATQIRGHTGSDTQPAVHPPGQGTSWV